MSWLDITCRVAKGHQAAPGVCKEAEVRPAGLTPLQLLVRRGTSATKSLIPVSLCVCQLALQVDSHKSLRAEQLVPPQDERDFIQAGQCQRGRFEIKPLHAKKIGV